MAAYVIADVDVTDPQGMGEYVRMVVPTVEQFGGRYLVFGASASALEGGWEPQTMALIEFQTVEHARDWWESDVYAAAKAQRQRSSNCNLIVVAGV